MAAAVCLFIYLFACLITCLAHSHTVFLFIFQRCFSYFTSIHVPSQSFASILISIQSVSVVYDGYTHSFIGQYTEYISVIHHTMWLCTRERPLDEMYFLSLYENNFPCDRSLSSVMSKHEKKSSQPASQPAQKSERHTLNKYKILKIFVHWAMIPRTAHNIKWSEAKIHTHFEMEHTRTRSHTVTQRVLGLYSIWLTFCHPLSLSHSHCLMLVHI